MSKVDYGTVQLELDGETVELSPTIQCARNIKRWGLGSPIEAMQRVQGFDVDDLAIVVAAGSGKGQREVKPLAETIHNAGSIHIAPKVVEFLAMLINPTGRDPDEVREEEGDEPGE